MPLTSWLYLFPPTPPHPAPQTAAVGRVTKLGQLFLPCAGKEEKGYSVANGLAWAAGNIPGFSSGLQSRLLPFCTTSRSKGKNHAVTGEPAAGGAL